MQAAGNPGPKILFELSQVETGVRCKIYVTAFKPRLGTASAHPFCLRATRAKSQYKVGLSALCEAQHSSRKRWASVDRADVSPTYVHAFAFSAKSARCTRTTQKRWPLGA